MSCYDHKINAVVLSVDPVLFCVEVCFTGLRVKRVSQHTTYKAHTAKLKI